MARMAERFATGGVPTGAIRCLVVISITMGITGAITSETLKLYALGFPFMLAGLWIGFKLYGTINDETFRKAVLVLLLFAGLSLIVPALIFREP